MTSFPTNRLLSRVLQLSSGLCIALAGCAAQPELRDDPVIAGESLRSTWSVHDSSASTYGPNVGSEDASLGLELARAPELSNSAAPQGATFLPGWYFLAGLGYSCAESSQFDVDNMDWTYHAAAGYRFLRYLGVEAGYINLGTHKYDVNGGANDGEIKTDGVQLSAIGYYPIYSIFEAMARVGVFAWSEDNKTFGAGTAHDDGTALLWGLGVQARIAPHWAARLEWTSVENSGNDADFCNTMLSAIWML